MSLSCACSEHLAVSWLRGLLVSNHFVFQTYEEGLEGVAGVPWIKHLERIGYRAVTLTHAGKINL